MNDPCLKCTLPICDDKSAECAFTQLTRGLTAQDIERRSDQRDYYAANKEAMHESQKKWRAKTDRTEYWKRYYKKHRKAKQAAARERYIPVKLRTI